MPINVGGGVEWQMAAAIGAAALLLMWQAQRISRWRIAAAVALVVVVVSCRVFAEPQILIPNRCAELTVWDAEYWLLGCWGVPGLPDGK